MRSRIWIIAAGAAVVLALAAACGGGGDGAPANTIRPGENKVFGEPDAPVEVVEYFDYR